MDEAVEHLRRRAVIYFVVDADHPDDLLKLDEHVFAKRPDLILSISPRDMKERYPVSFLSRLAGLRHVAALQLNLYHSNDLNELGQLKGMKYLSIYSKKPQDLSFLTNYQELEYLSLRGKFVDLSPIGEVTSLDTLLLSVPIYDLSFISQLPRLKYLSIHDCTLEGSLDALIASTVRILRLAAIRHLTELDILASIPHLACLYLALPKVEQLFDFSRLEHLKQLELDNMKGLRNIEHLWTARHLELLTLREISSAVKAKDLEPLVGLDSLRQLDFQYIDFNKGRIAALREWITQAGKEAILYENIAEEQRIRPMDQEHLIQHLGWGGA